MAYLDATTSQLLERSVGCQCVGQNVGSDLPSFDTNLSVATFPSSLPKPTAICVRGQATAMQSALSSSPVCCIADVSAVEAAISSSPDFVGLDNIGSAAGLTRGFYQREGSPSP